MKKRITSLLAAAFSLLCALSVLALPASADRAFEDLIENNGLYDPDNVFSASDYIDVNTAIVQTSNDIDMYVAVLITGEHAERYTDAEIESQAHDYYDKLFNVHSTHGTETDGVLLYLSLSTHYAFMSTCGIGQIYYYNGNEDNRCVAITEGMTDYLRAEDYAGAINYFCNQLKAYRKESLPKNAYTYNSSNGEYAYIQGGKLVYADKLPWWVGVNWGFLIPLAVIIGAVVGFIAALIVRSSYKLKKSLEPTNYISNQETQFFVQDDLFLREHVSKTRIDSDSGRGGGGGGGGFSSSSGGGFSHGGGGSHW